MVDNRILQINHYLVDRLVWFVRSTLIHWIAISLVNNILFHTYWDFRIESIAWKTHTEISSSNHNRESTSHTWGKPFHPIRNQLSEWISQFANVFTLFLASLQSSFTEVCRVSTRLLKFSRKFAINHRQSSNRFIALDKPIKKYIQEERSKKTRTKTRWDARLACLANFSTEGRGKKSFKEGKYAVSLFRRQRVLPSKEMSESSKQTT